MRLRTDIWVKAYLRICAVAGAQGYVVRHGDDDAGAVYIKVTGADRSSRVFAPAPTGLDDADTERRWLCITGAQSVAEADADAKLSRETAYDDDFWVIEIEDRHGRHFLDDWLAPGET